jgi:hypothetical protein
VVSRTEQLTIEAAAAGDALNIVLSLSTIGYAQLQRIVTGSAAELLAEKVAIIRRFFGRVETTTMPDMRGAEDALAELASLLTQVPLDVPELEHRAKALGECTGLLPLGAAVSR